MDSYWALISIFHIFFVVPLFLTVGLLRSATPIWLYWVMLILGVVVLFYHGYKAIIRWSTGSNLLAISLIHTILIAPLLIYVGYQQKNSLRWSYELLMLAGFGALGYHLYNLVGVLQL